MKKSIPKTEAQRAKTPAERQRIAERQLRQQEHPLARPLGARQPPRKK